MLLPALSRTLLLPSHRQPPMPLSTADHKGSLEPAMPACDDGGCSCNTERPPVNKGRGGEGSAFSKGCEGAPSTCCKRSMKVAAREEVGSLVHTIGLYWHAAGWLDPFLIRKDLNHVGRAAGCRLPRRWLHGGAVTADAVIIFEEQAPSDTAGIVFF